MPPPPAAAAGLSPGGRPSKRRAWRAAAKAPPRARGEFWDTSGQASRPGVGQPVAPSSPQPCFRPPSQRARGSQWGLSLGQTGPRGRRKAAHLPPHLQTDSEGQPPPRRQSRARRLAEGSGSGRAASRAQGQLCPPAPPAAARLPWSMQAAVTSPEPRPPPSPLGAGAGQLPREMHQKPQQGYSEQCQ